MRSWCLCQICTCGRHRCPHGSTGIYENSGAFCPTTEYLEKYPTYGNVPPAQSLKPKQEALAHGGKMEGITTFKSDYRPYEVGPPPRHLPEEYRPTQGDIDLDTTYRQDFNAYPAHPVARVRPLERRHVKKGKLDTVPTYKDDYRAWAPEKSHLYKPEHAYHPPTVRFGNPTTFQDDYVPRAAQPRQSFKPGAAAPLSTAPFHGDTSHRLDFVPYELEPKPARPKRPYKPSSQPFQGLTTHRCAFRGLLGSAAKACRPPRARGPPDLPFEGRTEFRDSFQPWEMPPAHIKPVPAYVPPAGAMQLLTTSRQDYQVPRQAPRAAPIRPASQRRKKFPFQGRSTTQEDFPEWEACRPREPVRPQQQMPGPSGTFDGVSTFQCHYVPHQLAPTASCKPAQAALRSSSPFDGVTWYSTEFAPKEREVCPASYPSPPGYIFDTTNSRGHKFFRKVAPASSSGQAS
ncbi:stabilizer of axonemal microtubules 2 [Myotis daubentonii]|uniref:stabilizer of axonemal microtubules 2 n=1 Tax=Myotis daubentonii TaxID=98922 RepID=UPI002872F7C1|nr:stabilizer of axonemal microtubules 2 [Myotis daubentonii]